MPFHTDPAVDDAMDDVDDGDESNMSFDEFNKCLYQLGMSRIEYAAEMRLAERTVRSWKSDGIPFYVEANLKLMRRLKQHGLPWTLGGRTPVLPGTTSSQASATARRKAMRGAAAAFMGVDEIVERLRRENKALAPWAVDLEGESAQLGTLKLRFHLRPEGGFIPLSYERSDDEHDAAADWPFLVDGFGCIAREMEKQNKPFAPKLQLGQVIRRPDGYVLWELRLAPRVVLTIPDTAVAELIPVATERREFLDLNHSRLTKYVEQSMEYVLGFGDSETGLTTINLDAAALRGILEAEPGEGEGS